AAPRLVSGGHLQGPPHPARRRPGRRVGAAGQHEPSLPRPVASGLHACRRPARDADGPPPGRRPPGRGVTGPRTTIVRRLDTHRLIPSRYLPRGDSVLTLIAEDDREL